MKTQNITIGIPAYNEEANIGSLLLSIVGQVCPGMRIENIIVASDASSDNTNRIVKKIATVFPQIKLMKNVDRLGKSERINQIFTISDTEFTVILDADIQLGSNTTVYQLVLPMIKDNKVMLTSGRSLPKTPVSFAQKIAYAGFKFWDRARFITQNSDMYYCEGPIRAFRKKLYKEIVMPKSVAEDVFPYLYCADRKYKFEKSSSAIVFYTLPSSTGDYTSQMTRAISTYKAQHNNFDEIFINRYYTIGYKEKFKSLFASLIENPFWTFLFLSVVILPKLKEIFSSTKDSGTWNIVQSTKSNV